MQIIQLPLALLPAVFYFEWVWPTLADTPWLLAIGLTGMSAHFCLARAFQLADATFCMPVDFVRLPLTALIGWLVYSEGVSVWVLVGAFLIFGSNYYAGLGFHYTNVSTDETLHTSSYGDESITGFQLALGMNSGNLRYEVSYSDFADIELTSSNGDKITADADNMMFKLSYIFGQ